jgi:hypothetical protein
VTVKEHLPSGDTFTASILLAGYAVCGLRNNESSGAAAGVVTVSEDLRIAAPVVHLSIRDQLNIENADVKEVFQCSKQRPYCVNHHI